MKYNVHLKLDCSYDGIEAESKEEAFEIASQWAIEGGTWDYSIDEEEDDDEIKFCFNPETGKFE